MPIVKVVPLNPEPEIFWSSVEDFEVLIAIALACSEVMPVLAVFAVIAQLGQR